MRAIVPALVAGAVVLLACDRPEGNAPADDAARGDTAAAEAPPGAAVDADATGDREDTVTIEEALAEHTDAWMEIDGVEGTGIGLCDDVPCIKVFVSRPSEEFSDIVPDSVDGHRVRIEPTGRFEVQ